MSSSVRDAAELSVAAAEVTDRRNPRFVVPAKAGTQATHVPADVLPGRSVAWAPAFAGATIQDFELLADGELGARCDCALRLDRRNPRFVVPAKAGTQATHVSREHFPGEP
jgi:hypothetical protein